MITDGLQRAREEKCDVVVAIGGGSVIDAGKAIAGLLTNSGDVLDYLEVVGNGQPLQNPAAPFIAVPTTAGTGAEVTRNAVLGVPERKVKVSLRSPFLLPRLAVVDPELTLGLPPAITAHTGLDALTQLIEAYTCIRANPVTDGFCTQGIPLAARSLRRSFHHSDDLNARRDMSLAALLSGLALANAGLGVVHGFAAPLGGKVPRPARRSLRSDSSLWHGNESTRAAANACRKAKSLAPLPGRGAECSPAVPPPCRRRDRVGARTSASELEIPPLRAYGIGQQDVRSSSPKPPKPAA